MLWWVEATFWAALALFVIYAVLKGKQKERECDAIVAANPPDPALVERERELYYRLPPGACDRPEGPPPQTGVPCLDERIISERVFDHMSAIMFDRRPPFPFGTGWCAYRRNNATNTTAFETLFLIAVDMASPSPVPQ